MCKRTLHAVWRTADRVPLDRVPAEQSEAEAGSWSPASRSTLLQKLLQSLFLEFQWSINIPFSLLVRRNATEEIYSSLTLITRPTPGPKIAQYRGSRSMDKKAKFSKIAQYNSWFSWRFTDKRRLSSLRLPKIAQYRSRSTDKKTKRCKIAQAEIAQYCLRLLRS